MNPIYLDYNATTPVDPRVLEAMLPFFSQTFGNAASTSHIFGRTAKSAVEGSRKIVAQHLGAEPSEIIFTSGSTEALNMLIKGVAAANLTKGNHIVTVCSEHQAVLDTCGFMEENGYDVTYLPVDSNGMIDSILLQQAIRPETVLVCVMMVNNETGVLQNIEELVAVAHAHGAFFLTDATQAVGKIPVNVRELGVDALCFSAHKFYGPKGIGGIFLNKKMSVAKPFPILHGGKHEFGFRSGTLNVPGIVGMTEALHIAVEEMETAAAVIKSLAKTFAEAMKKNCGATLNGHPDLRLSHTVNLRFPGVSTEILLAKLSNQLGASAGSACSSGSEHYSHVLKGMGFSDEHASQSVRFSLGKPTTEDEISEAIALITAAVNDLKR